VPRVPAFLPTAIAFEPENIPLDGAFGTNVKHVKVAHRMGAVIDMNVARVLSATLTLMEPSGTPVPAGASARISATGEEFAVAKRGRVYVSGLDRDTPTVLHVQIGERACRATIDVPDSFTSGGTLGAFTCQ
jgi:outer membrane usher protein FimD/PapC